MIKTVVGLSISLIIILLLYQLCRLVFKPPSTSSALRFSPHILPLNLHLGAEFVHEAFHLLLLGWFGLQTNSNGAKLHTAYRQGSSEEGSRRGIQWSKEKEGMSEGACLGEDKAQEEVVQDFSRVVLEKVEGGVFDHDSDDAPHMPGAFNDFNRRIVHTAMYNRNTRARNDGTIISTYDLTSDAKRPRTEEVAVKTPTTGNSRFTAETLSTEFQTNLRAGPLELNERDGLGLANNHEGTISQEDEPEVGAHEGGSYEHTVAAMIAKLPAPAGVNLKGLIQCATTRLSRPLCCSISVLGYGSSNIVYLLNFIDGSDVAASIPLCQPSKFNAAAKQSEIATMYFVRDSGLFPRIPVPAIYAWNLSYSNPVKTPYVFMEAIHGRQISEQTKTVEGCVLTGLDALETDEQMVVTRSLAQLHADLKIPLHQFTQIGSITRRRAADGDFYIGPLYSVNGEKQGGPFSSLGQYWSTVVDDEVRLAMDDWHGRKTEQLSIFVEDPLGTPKDFSASLHFLSVLIPWFIPPESQQFLVLSHPDLALRNIIFDCNDLSKIVAVLDWSGAAVLPLVLAGAFPSDLMTKEGDHPQTSEILKQSLEGSWHMVPFDWTFLDQIEKIQWPEALSPLGSAVVRRYYLRQHFSSYYAMKCDHDITRASLFNDAPYYLKFHELLSGGWRSWLQHSAWISDTYWRIKWKVAGYDGTPIIVGPNVYSQPVQREPLILDLGNVNTETKPFSRFSKL